MFDLTENRMFTKPGNFYNFQNNISYYNSCDICGEKIIELRDGKHAYLCKKCSDMCNKSFDRSENMFYNKGDMLLQDLERSNNLFLKYIRSKELSTLGDSSQEYVENVFLDPLMYYEEFNNGEIRWI